MRIKQIRGFLSGQAAVTLETLMSLQAHYRPLRPLRDKLSHMFLFGSGTRLTTLQVKPVVQLHGTWQLQRQWRRMGRISWNGVIHGASFSGSG